MKNYSIMPLHTEYVDELCSDIKRQYNEGVTSCALFKMPLVPEGVPVIDKASLFCEAYELFQKKLASMRIPSGILVQCTIGHGYRLNQDSPFQQYISYKSGEPEYICCPYDEDFRKHMFSQFATLAKRHPAMIMVDDDFRLMHRSGLGCTCPLHMKHISDRYGRNLTREEFVEKMNQGDEELFRIFYETQRDSLLGAAQAMRDGINSVDPSIPGSFCICGNDTEFGGEIASILAGEGNPVTVRVNNARYTSPGAREFSPIMYRAAAPIALLKSIADDILAETDTCPQNRYSTSASNLHSHFTASILEGCTGAKQWITRMVDYEPQSGEAYRVILSKYAGFYQALSELTPSLCWVGCRIPIPGKPQICIGWDQKSTNGWHDHVLERMGIPFYFSEKIGGATFLDGDDDELYTDEEMTEILTGEVYCSIEAAEKLIRRGFGECLGIDVSEWNGVNASGEYLYTNKRRCAMQMCFKEIKPLYSTVEPLSEVYHINRNGEREALFPGVTQFENKLGGRVTVFCGTPKTPYTYYEAFSFLNESRKKQLVSLLKRGDHLPAYYDGDAEICFRAAWISGSDSLLCVIYNIGFDPLEKIELDVSFAVKNVSVLDPDGVFRNVEYKPDGDSLLIGVAAYTLYPVVCKIEAGEKS